jgi:glyoxylase-like metal-dependent hydrolase (beta-lactamase superfamily II)
MSVTRRQFLVRSSIAFAAGIIAPRFPSLAAEPAKGITELRGSVAIFEGRGGTVGWLLRSDAVVLVDSAYPRSAGKCLEELRKRTERKIDALINTHHHRDHTGGNGVLRPEAQRIVAHENVPILQEQVAEREKTTADQTYADTTFSRSWRMDAGGETIHARHYGPAHTGGDCVVHFEEANVAHMGDLVFNRFHPFIDLPGGASIRGWIELLDRVVSEYDRETLFIFGHGRPGFGVTGGARDLVLMRDYLTALIEAARKAAAAGRSVDELASMNSLPDFEDHEAPSPRLSLEANLRAAWEEAIEGS